MSRGSCTLYFLSAAVLLGQTAGDNGEELERIKARVRDQLTRAPDFVCQQSIQRSRRETKANVWARVDTLRLEVSVVGKREIYAWPNASKFEEKELHDMVGRGIVGTGSYALHLNNIFLGDAAEFTPAGEVEIGGGRKAIRYDFEVPRAKSRYRVRIQSVEGIVGYRGAFWADPETLDLVKFMVAAGDDVPEDLGLASLEETVEYAPQRIGEILHRLPKAGELIIADTHGDVSRNQTQFTACRQYIAESKVSFIGEAPATPEAKEEPAPALAPRLLVDAVLDHDIDPAAASIGDAVRAVLTKPVKEGDKMVAPEGALLHGRLTRIERASQPIDHFVVALEFHTLENGPVRLAFQASLEDLTGGAGLIKQEKRMDPVFDKKRRNSFLSILVREHQKGQAIVHWDARHSKIRKGLKMKWETK